MCHFIPVSDIRQVQGFQLAAIDLGKEVRRTPSGKFEDSRRLRVAALSSLCYSWCGQMIYDLMRRDPSFPRLGQIGSEFSAGWLRVEVMDWLNSRPLAKFNVLDIEWLPGGCVL